MKLQKKTLPPESVKIQNMSPSTPPTTSYGNLNQLPPEYHESADIGGSAAPSPPPPSNKAMIPPINPIRPFRLASLNPLPKTPASTVISEVELNTFPSYNQINRSNRIARKKKNRSCVSAKTRRRLCITIPAIMILVGIAVVITFVMLRLNAQQRADWAAQDGTTTQNGTVENQTDTISTPKHTPEVIFDGVTTYDICIAKHPWSGFLWC